jgi:HD-GYP domain-containing protein (c-di-GMP phosphodiesterase class II)
MRLQRTLLLVVAVAAAVPSALLGWLAAEAHVEVRAATVVALVVALLVGATLSVWVARRVVSPLRDVVTAALEIAGGRFGREVAVRGRNEIADLAYAFNHMSRELKSYDQENRELIQKLERGYLETIRALAGAIDAKDPYTRGHSERVAQLSVEIGLELALPPDELRALEMGGILHDVGKIGIPDVVLGKPGALDDAETELMRTHPRVGAEIIQGVEFLRHALPCVRNHHERWDGAGYPDGLARDDIPLIARIVNAADTWDACTTERPYQRAIEPHAVLDILDRLRGAQLDPEVHDALVAVLRRRGEVPASAA